MATTIQQVVGETSSTPSNGQPWNFKELRDSYLLPRVIVRDMALMPGARLLWGVLRQQHCLNGRCTLSNESLARAVGVGWHQCIRYCRQLERAGLMRTTSRPGKTPVRELLWDSRFAGAIRKPPAFQGSTHCLPGQPPLPSKAPLYKEEVVSKVVLEVKKESEYKIRSPKPAAPPAPKPAAEWSEEDYIARGRACGFPEHMIQRELESLRARRAREQKIVAKDPAEVAAVIAAITGR